jgi:hypothetical protein
MSESKQTIPLPPLWAECGYCKEAGEEERLHPIEELRWNGEHWCCEECSGDERDLWEGAPRIAGSPNLVAVEAFAKEALEQPFCVLFLDGRNEHGSHVLPSFPRSFDITETNIEDEAETILSAAESLGFAVGDHVWAEFIWNPPQIVDEGRIEFIGYWEFKRINVEMTKATLSPPTREEGVRGND